MTKEEELMEKLYEFNEFYKKNFPNTRLIAKFGDFYFELLDDEDVEMIKERGK